MVSALVEPTFSHWGSSEPFGLKQMASSSHSTYVASISKDAESPGPEGDDPVRRCDEYMAALDDARVLPAKDLFSSFVAWSNRTFLGIVSFGGGPSYTKGCVLWKYFGFHQILLLNSLFSVAPPLYVAGCSYFTAVILPVLAFAPMTLTTPIVEAKIFRSKFLVLHIERGGKLIEQIRKGGTPSQIVMFMTTSLVFSTIVLSVSIFWALGYTMSQGIDFLRIVILLNIVVTLVAQFINYGFQFWQPLVEIHQNEITDACKLAANTVVQLLYDENLTARATRAKLSDLTRRLIKPLQRELKLWADEVFFMLLFVVVQIAAGIWLVSMELESRRTDIVWPGVLFRYTLAVTSSLLMPLMVVGILRTAAKPFLAWSIVEDSLFSDAERSAAACEKFNGSPVLMNAWLRKNRLTLKLAGFPIDDTLPEKIVGCFVSILGAAALVISRNAGTFND